MKYFIHKVLSSILALLVLLSTVSWTVDKHLCMGRVMDIAFFVEADDCGMEAAIELMGDEFQNHCCGDETFTQQGQDDLKLNWNDIELEQQFFMVAFTHSYLKSFYPINNKVVPHEQYPPPKLVKDIQLLDQVFLI
ncbi:MAG: hypothetical protein AB8B59_08495 [Maribacter sp.]